MTIPERLGLAILDRMDPERAHELALAALRLGLGPRREPISSPRLATRLAGMDLPNPVGLAAGFDKNAVAVRPLGSAGFGFLEFGAATPRPQTGSPRPRLFRLAEDRAAINRFGFNNDGAEAIVRRLANAPRTCARGLNLGANKDSPDRARDFADTLRAAGPHIDFATVNVSSPNTEGLRDLQAAAALDGLLAGVAEARAELARPIPVFLKIAPDLDDAGIVEIASAAMRAKIDGIVATNTTLARDGLRSSHRGEAGGLSGAPLFERSTRALARLSRETAGAIPLIGVGGIASADDAYAKILAGASAVQLYTAMVYEGLSLIPEIVKGLDALLARDGFENVAAAAGAAREDWT